MRGPTEGVPRNIAWPFLRRNILTPQDDDDENGRSPLPEFQDENLVIQFNPHNYRIQYEVGTSESFYYGKRSRSQGMSGMASLTEERKAKFEDKFVKNAKWMAGMSLDDVNAKKAEFHRLANAEPSADVDETKLKNEPEDHTMAGT